MRGMGRVYLRGNVWWVQYYFNGRKHRESTGSPSRPDAMRLLRSRLEEIGRGRLVGPAIERTTFDDLAELLLTDYRINRKRSIARIEDSVEHLGRVFTGFLAINVTSDRIMAYIGTRQNADAANGTINRELSAACSALGNRQGKLPIVRISRCFARTMCGRDFSRLNNFGLSSPTCRRH